MEQRARVIEEQIREARADLGRNLQELEDRARAITDWRVHYREHTAVGLALAFGTGVVLASLTARSSVPRARLREVVDPSGSVGRQVNDVWGRALGALIGVASVAAVSRIERLIPGFQRQFDAGTFGGR